MDDEEYAAITRGLRASIQRYPNCKVASCECDEYAGEWKPGCFCTGHWFALNDAFGDNKGDWSFADASASAREGKPVRADPHPTVEG